MGGHAFAGFRCGKRLGVGRYGEVYRALNGAGEVARLTLVDGELGRRDGFAAALIREGAVAATLAHPNVVAVRAVGRSGEGALAALSDEVDGAVALAALLRGGLALELALFVGRGIAAGLAHSHSRGVVHAGLEPDCVLVDSFGRVRIADFALAGALAAAARQPGGAELFAEESAHLAPELGRGAPSTRASDVFAAGRLFKLALASSVVGGRLAALIARALSRDPAERPADGGELARALEEAIVGDALTVADPEGLADYLGSRRAAPLEAENR